MSYCLKYFLLFLVSLIAFLRTYGNAIDSIKTKEDVFKFIKSNPIKISPDHLSYRGMNDTVKVSSIDTSGVFCKADIDGNGKTDIIIGGRCSTVIMDVNGKYIAYPLEIVVFITGIPYSFEKVIELSNHSTALLCKHQEEKYWEQSKTVIHDTLVFKFNAFIEYRPTHAHPGINRIEFIEEPGGMSTVTESQIEIKKNGVAIYKPSHNNGTRSPAVQQLLFGIDSNQLTELWNLLTYVDPGLLKNKYGFYGVSDESTAIFNIYFEDGTVKKIEDYALAGTLGLRAVYNKIFDIQKSQDLQKK